MVAKEVLWVALDALMNENWVVFKFRTVAVSTKMSLKDWPATSFLGTKAELGRLQFGDQMDGALLGVRGK